MKKRLFFAIDLPAEVKRVFKNFFKNINELREVKWEKPEKLHLTLAFLGWVDGKNIPILISLVRSLKVGRRPLRLIIIPQISGFPAISNPRVLWLPIRGEVEKLRDTAQFLQKILKDKSFRLDEREFAGHLTIGRFREGVGKNIKEKIIKEIIEHLPKQPIEFEVNRITLFESRLTPKGSIYEVVAYEDFGNRNKL